MENQFISPYVYAGLPMGKIEKPIVSNETNQAIIKDVCKVMGYTFEEVDNHSRKREIVFVRHAICYWLRYITKLTFDSIATVFTGSRDHSSIINSVNVWEGLVLYDKEIMKVNNKIKEIMIRKYL